MEDLPYDLSQALKESSKVVEQTVRRHNRKRRGKKRRSNPDLDFDLNEVDFPNRSDASSGGEGAAAAEEERGDQGGAAAGQRGAGGGSGGGGVSSGVAEHGSADVTPGGSTAALTTAAAAGSSCSLCGSSGCSAGGGAASVAALPTVMDLLHHSGGGGATTAARAAAAAAAARSDSDDVHIAARLSALTLPPTATPQLSCAAEAAAAAVTASAAAAAAAAGSKSAVVGAGVYGASASCGRTIKDLESDSVTEKSPVRPLNQRRRRRLRHMLVDEAVGIPVVPDASVARAAVRNKPPAPAVPHGGRRAADFGAVPVSVSSSSNVLAQAGPVRQLWKRKRKQKMDTSEVSPGQAAAAAASVAELADGDSGGEDERMQGELLSSELSSTSSEDECDARRWSHHQEGASYDAAQEGDDEQSDFFHEPGPAYGIPPGTAVAWWGKENKSGGGSCDSSRPTFVAAAAAAAGSHSIFRAPPKDGFLAPFAGDERFSKHRLYSKLDRPFRIGRRRLKSASYRPAHDELGYYAASGSASSARACSSLLVPSQLAQQLSQSSDIKRRRKTNLAAPFDEPNSTAISRSILIPHASTASHTSKRANDGLSRASL